MGKFSIAVAIFNSNVRLPDGIGALVGNGGMGLLLILMDHPQITNQAAASLNGDFMIPNDFSGINMCLVLKGICY